MHQRNRRATAQSAIFAPSGARLDETDVAILFLLQRDARVTIQKIADFVGLSHSGALARLRRLDESGAVLRHVAELDESLFDAWTTFLVEIELTPAGRAARSEIEKTIRAAPEILDATELIAEGDLLLKVSLPAPALWATLRQKIDPKSLFIEKARLRLLGRSLKRGAPHPLLAASLSPRF